MGQVQGTEWGSWQEGPKVDSEEKGWRTGVVMQFCPALQAAQFGLLSNTRLSWYRVEEGQGSMCPGQQSSCRVGVQAWILERSGYKEFISALAHSQGENNHSHKIGLDNLQKPSPSARLSALLPRPSSTGKQCAWKLKDRLWDQCLGTDFGSTT